MSPNPWSWLAQPSHYGKLLGRQRNTTSLSAQHIRTTRKPSTPSRPGLTWNLCKDAQLTPSTKMPIYSSTERTDETNTMSLQQVQEWSTKPIPLHRAFRKGDIISLKLFISPLEDVFKTLDRNGRGININDATSCYVSGALFP